MGYGAALESNREGDGGISTEKPHTVCSHDSLFKTCFKGLCSVRPALKDERPVAVGSKVV